MQRSARRRAATIPPNLKCAAVRLRRSTPTKRGFGLPPAGAAVTSVTQTPPATATAAPSPNAPIGAAAIVRPEPDALVRSAKGYAPSSLRRGAFLSRVALSDRARVGQADPVIDDFEMTTISVSDVIAPGRQADPRSVLAGSLCGLLLPGWTTTATPLRRRIAVGITVKDQHVRFV
jgi:hypothetical protein